MSLILAIEPDRRQSLTLTTLSRARLNAELVLGETASRALEALGSRKPDLVLTSPRLTDTDEATLASRLRAFEVAGTPVPRMVIPQLGPPLLEKKGKAGRPKPHTGATYCAPLAFGEQIADCLETAAAERAALAAAQAELEAAWATEVTDSQRKIAASPSPQSFVLEPTALEAPRQLIVAAGAALDEVATTQAVAAVELVGPRAPIAAVDSVVSFAPIAAVESMPSMVSVSPMEVVDDDSLAAVLDTSFEPYGASAAHDRADWEELSLDAVGQPARARETASLDEPEPAPAIAAIALDAELEAFVLQLEASPRAAEHDDNPLVAALDPASAPLEAAWADDGKSSSAPESETAIEPLTRTTLPIGIPIGSAIDVQPVPADEGPDDVGEVARADATLAAAIGLSPSLPQLFGAPAEPALSPAPAPEPPTAGIHDVLSAIRRDIQHLRGDDPVRPRPAAQRADATEPTPLISQAPAVAPGPSVAEEREPTAGAAEASAGSLEPAATAVGAKAPATEPVASHEPRREPMPWRPRIKSRPPTVPVQDEWGFFDPERCGFEALRAKLNEMIEAHARKRTA